jgi:hypothetical protein
MVFEFEKGEELNRSISPTHNAKFFSVLQLVFTLIDKYIIYSFFCKEISQNTNKKALGLKKK